MLNVIRVWGCICWVFTVIICTHSAHANEVKAVVIESLDDQSQIIVPGLKAQYELCVQTKQTILKTKYEKPEIWPSMKKSLKPDYIVDAQPAAEPDWVSMAVGKFISKEYFYGDNYAKYEQRARYKISKDGLCTLIIDKTESREIDNGKERYLIGMKAYIDNRDAISDSSSRPPYKNIRVQRLVSPVKTQIESDHELNRLINEQPQVARYLNIFLDSGVSLTQGTSPGMSSKTVDILRESFGLVEDKANSNIQAPRANDENFVLGNACDIVGSTSLNTRLWYWQRMRHYPSIMRRPIILKREVKWGNRIAVQEATQFKIRDRLDEKIFIPPKEIR